MTLPRRPSLPLLDVSHSALQSRPIRKRDPEQPNLPFDPMPHRVEPCLALLKSVAPLGPDWLYEVKWDGYRLAIHIEPMGVSIITRGGRDWTHRFPSIAAAARDLGVTTAILDGEAVVLDDQGRRTLAPCSVRSEVGAANGSRPSPSSTPSTFSISTDTISLEPSLPCAGAFLKI